MSNFKVGDAVVVTKGAYVYATHTEVMCHADRLASNGAVVKVIKGRVNVTLHVKTPSGKVFAVHTDECELAVSAEKLAVLNRIARIESELAELRSEASDIA